MANFIETNDLDDEDILLLETLAERLRKKTTAKRTRPKKASNAEMPEDILAATAGAWKDTVDCEELKRRIYDDRLVPTRGHTMKVRYLVDTDWIIDHLANVRATTKKLRELQPEGIALSVVSLAELYEGVYYARDPEKNETILRK